MAENYRKCFKCGCSPAVDQSVKLFRFPKPGVTNSIKCELWAKYCIPDGDWSSREVHQKLYREHRMLCNKHFKTTAFIDPSMKKLHKFAVPHEMEFKTVFVPQPGTSSLSQPLQNKTNVQTENVPLVRQPLKKTMEKPTLDPSLQVSQEHVILETGQHVEKKTGKTRDNYLYAKCRKHMKRICSLRNRIKKLKNKTLLQEITSDDSVQALMQKLTPTFALLLQSQLKNSSKKTTGKRWATDEKIMALRLYKRSPTCYRFMRRLFCLPAQSTLKALLGQFDLNVGLDNQIFDVLAKYAKHQKPSDNEYVLMFDEMSIKKNLIYNKKNDVIDGFQDHGDQGRSDKVASHFLVFMVAGIRKKVKQPVAFYTSSSSVTADRLAVLLKGVLRRCFQAGLNIATTVCDMDGVNRRALSILGATVDRPYIYVDDVEVITMFDPPHLLKCFRNLFHKYDIKCTTHIKSGNKSGEGVAKWSHIVKFHQLDSSNPNFVFAPALKHEHLNPNTKQKMKVKLATQVFSHTVAAGMMAKISAGQLTTAAATTVDVIESMDKLFDALNSDSSDLRRGKMYATNVKKSSPHLQFFKEMKNFFNSLQFIGCNRPPPSQEGWVWTLNAVDRLWTTLTNKHHDIKSLATRRLQQDPLENLFGCIRSNCGCNNNPTTGQFVAGLKTAILSNLAHFSTGNCERDSYDTIIDNYKMVLTKKPTNLCTEITDASISGTQMESNYDIDEFGHFCDAELSKEEGGEIQACAYVCGFLVKNLIEKDCENCNNIFIAKETAIEHLFIQCKEYSTSKDRLNYCSKNNIEYVESCATKANTLLKNIGHEHNIKLKIRNELLKLNVDFLRSCEVHFEKNVNFLTQSVFHICVKRFCILKNRNFAEESAKIALKKKIEILKHK